MSSSDRSINIPGFSYTFIQCGMLFLTYGLKYAMPWWVIWFPSLVLGTFLTVVGIIMLVVLIIAALTD